MVNTNNDILVIVLICLWLHLFYSYKMPITYNLITSAKIKYWPLSLSNIHSETLYGNKNLSFLWTSLGFILYTIDTTNFKCFHLLLALLSLFSNKSLNNTCVICIDISTELSNLSHQIIVISYLLIHPIIRIYYVSNLLYSYTSILCTIVLIPMFLYDYTYTAFFEAAFMSILSLLVY